LKHHGCDLCRFNLHALFQVADLIVLAKTAEQITGTHKNGPRPISSHQWRLFTKVGIIAGNPGLPPRFTVTQLALQAVHLAFSWAEAA
jgi:hypothetical protein